MTKKILLLGLGILLGVGIVVAYTALSARYFPTDLTVKFYLRLHGIKSEVNCAVYDGSHNHVNISCSAAPSQIQALAWIRDLTWLSCRCVEFDLTDELYEYRHVILTKELYEKIAHKKKLLTIKLPYS